MVEKIWLAQHLFIRGYFFQRAIRFYFLMSVCLYLSQKNSSLLDGWILFSVHLVFVQLYIFLLASLSSSFSSTFNFIPSSFPFLSMLLRTFSHLVQQWWWHWWWRWCRTKDLYSSIDCVVALPLFFLLDRCTLSSPVFFPLFFLLSYFYISINWI